MLTTEQAAEVAELLYRIDTNVRHDLHQDQINDERDYVSRLVTHFNYPFGLFNRYLLGKLKFQSKWFSRVNSSHHERKFGCDSMIVFQVGNQVKVGLFEAKWPRILKDPSHAWDYAQKSTKTSHFSHQINRQAPWTKQAVIWEMFFYEEKVSSLNKPFDTYGSTCILHRYAHSLVKSTPHLKILWDNADLDTLIKSAQTVNFDGENETNLRSIILEILSTNAGETIDITPTDNSFILEASDNQEARIPIIRFDTREAVDQNVEGFMERSGLSFFHYLKITSFDILDQIDGI